MDEDDAVHTSIAAYSNDPHAYARRYAEHLLDRPARFASMLPPSARILDLGCGPGRDLRLFSDTGHHPVGVEANPDFIQMARRHGDVIAADFRTIGDLFTPGSFDGVWAQASLVHLSRGDITLLLPTILDLLRPGGFFYACVPASGLTGWKDEEDGRRWYTVWPDDSFPLAVNEAGFQIDDVTDGVYIEVWATTP